MIIQSNFDVTDLKHFNNKEEVLLALIEQLRDNMSNQIYKFQAKSKTAFSYLSEKDRKAMCDSVLSRLKEKYILVDRILNNIIISE